MSMEQAPSIYITEHDSDTLEHLLDTPAVRALPGMDALRQELQRAHVVPSNKLPANVISMNSTARFVDQTSGMTHELTLVYPQAADSDVGRVSVTAPVGSALLGLSVGQTIEWQVPGGRKIRLKVLEVLHQPEAAAK